MVELDNLLAGLLILLQPLKQMHLGLLDIMFQVVHLNWLILLNYVFNF